jgi:hypothetical protein
VSNQLSNDEQRQRRTGRTTPDTEPQASQATRQARRAASLLRDEEVAPTLADVGHPRARSSTSITLGRMIVGAYLGIPASALTYTTCLSRCGFARGCGSDKGRCRN